MQLEKMQLEKTEVFEIKSDSMEDELRHAICKSDIVICEEVLRECWESKLHTKKPFVIIHPATGIICKEVLSYDQDRNTILCHSFNPAYEDFELNLSEVERLYRVKEVRIEVA